MNTQPRVPPQRRFARRRFAVGLAALSLLTACATLPTGPSVMALPGSNKGFDDFRLADSDCRQYAQSSIGQSAEKNAEESSLKSIAYGAVIGAAAGALGGGNARDAGASAGVGMIGGALAGLGSGQESLSGSQRRYDNAYIQCMYGKGHKVPVAGRMMENDSPASAARPQLSGKQSSDRPEPPPGNPPPPPKY